MDTATSHILVPVDFSEKSIFGLQMASNMSKTLGGKVSVLNVIKGTDPIWSDFFSEEEKSTHLEKSALHLKHFCEKYFTSQNVQVDYLIKKGNLCDTILNIAWSLDVSMIVMGTSTVNNIKKYIIGTNALRVVSEAHCPVITLKENPGSASINRIILPIDVTKETREKAVEAVQLAKSYNAEIKLIAAYTLTDDSIMHKLETGMHQVKEFIEGNGVKVSSDILKVNDRVDGVIDFIDEQKGDLIVITTHQQLEIIHSFMGSFAKSIIRLAKVPVMSVVPKVSHRVSFDFPGT